jgi:hypothetical protein
MAAGPLAAPDNGRVHAGKAELRRGLVATRRALSEQATDAARSAMLGAGEPSLRTFRSEQSPDRWNSSTTWSGTGVGFWSR